MDVWSETVPEFKGRAAESSAAFGAEAGGWQGEVKGGGRPEGTRKGNDAEEISQIRGGEVVNGFECI